jgi:acetyltransferase
MVIASAISMVLLALGAGTPAIIGILAISNLVIAVYICKLLPDYVIRSGLFFLLNSLYDIKVQGFENYHKCGKRTLIIANNNSFIDPLLIAAYLPDDITFVVDSTVAKRFWVKFFLRFASHIPVDHKMIRKIIDSSENGYLTPEKVQALMDAAGINRAKEIVVTEVASLKKGAKEIGFPIVMKVVGPVHKSDVGGVALNITDEESLIMEFNRMIKIPDTKAVLIQPMLSGTQIFIGAKREDKFGHLILCGLGGIFVEALHDISCGLSPVTKTEASEMIQSLRGYKLIQGTRGQEGVNEVLFNEAIRRVSALCTAAPEIFEMDLNPLLGNSKQVIAVDARIRIEK